MNTIKSTYAGWGAFSVAVLAGMAAANKWRQAREDEQVARGSKQMYEMTFEEKIMKAEWEAEQANLLKTGGDVHPIYAAEVEAKKSQIDKVGNSKWSSTQA